MEFQEDGMTEIGAVRIRRGRWLDGFFARVEPWTIRSIGMTPTAAENAEWRMDGVRPARRT